MRIITIIEIIFITWKKEKTLSSLQELFCIRVRRADEERSLAKVKEQNLRIVSERNSQLGTLLSVVLIFVVSYPQIHEDVSPEGSLFHHYQFMD